MAQNQDGSAEDDDAVPPYNPQHRFSMAFKRASYHPPDEIWNLFTEAEDCCDIIDYFSALIKALNIDPSIHGLEFYEILKSKLTSWKCQSLWDLLNARLKHSEYKQGKASKGKTCMIIGAGPIGLRTAIECLFLGCKTIIVEKREEFSRNNVLHLWPFLMTDFRNLGAKKFYGKFGSGCIEHINIRTLQCILLKVALILGVEVYVGVSFKGLVEPTDEETGWRAKFTPENHVLSKCDVDIVVGADGKKNVLPGFEQIELRGALAIGITCNFVNNNTIEEARVNEISGISFQYNQDFFIKMEEQYGVRLENIVYYKDETHYFVMTALKSSLLKLEVIKEDMSDPQQLLRPSNVDREKLIDFTRNAVQFATDHQLPDDLEFKQLSNGEPDIALFDFTSLKKASNASRIMERKKKKLLMTLVGDSLIEPFWPTGSGCGRGVLSALDCAWMIKQYCGGHPPLAVVRERENIFKLLSGISNDSLQKNYKTFTIDPKTRYTAFDSKKVSNLASLKSLYDTDDKENADFSVMSPQQPEKDTSYAKRRRRSSSGGRKKSVTSTHVHPHGQSGTTKHVKRRTDKSPLKDKKEEPPKVGDTKKFWEEHNKKNIEDRAKQHVSKSKQRSTPSIEEEIEAMEGWMELEDDVIADDNTSAKSSARSTRSQGKSPRDPKESVIRRQKSRDRLLKRQKSRENMGSTKSKSGTKAKTPDKEQKSLSRGTLKKENTKRKISIKQDPARPVDPKSFFRTWMERLTQNFKKRNEEVETNEVTEGTTISLCSQTALTSILAMPILFDCNRPPKRRTTDIKLKDLQLAKQALLAPTDDHKEIKEISLKRAGSVRDTIARLKEMTKDDNPSNYNDFLRRNRSGTDIDKCDGRISKTEDFQPKNVIDIEASVTLAEKKEKEKSKVVKSVWNSTSSDCERELHTALEDFCKSKASLDAVLMLQVLYNIHRRIHDEPDVEKYYRVYIKGSIFEKYVWNLDGSEDFLSFCGWIKCGNYLLLSKSYPIASSLKVIENVLREKKKAKVVYSSSDRKPTSKRPDLFKRRTKSNVGETVINEDELVASFTNIETDSNVDSGLDEEEVNDSKEIKKKKVQRVESKEQTLGNEEYVVVDFIGDLEVSSSRKTSQVEHASSPESAIGLSPPSPQSPTSTSSTFEQISVTSGSASIDVEPPVEAEKDGVNDEEIQEDVKENKNENTEEEEEERTVKKESEPIATAEQPPKKAVYSTGKGLKGIKKDAAEKEEKMKPVSKKAPDTKKSSDDGAEGKSLSRSLSTRSINSRKLSDERILRSSVDKSVSSSVLQNKLLFDQQIANQFKRNTSVESNPSSQSASRRSSIRSLNEMPVSGTVAGARSMFEATSTPTPVKKTGWEIKLEPVPPTPKSPEANEPAQTPETEKKTKKKRFPFKKKNKKASEKKENSKGENEPVPEDIKPTNDISCDESSKFNVSSDVTTESIDSEKEPDRVERKKKGSIFSKMRRLSRKSSGGESSENEPEKPHEPVEPKQPLEDEVIEEKDEISEPVPAEEPSTKEQLTLDIPPSRTSTNSSLPTPDVAPPSPGYASSEITAVLQGIIGRKSSLLDEEDEQVGEGGSSPKKKKRLKLKKRSSSKNMRPNSSETKAEDVIPEDDVAVEENKSGNDDVAMVSDTKEDSENPTIVAESKVIVEDHIPIVEDATTVVVKSDATISDWPKELATTNDDAENIDGTKIMPPKETGDSEENTTTGVFAAVGTSVTCDDEENDDVPALPVTHDHNLSDHTDVTDGDTTRDEDELVAALEKAGSTYDSDNLSVGTAGTNAEKKKRRLKLKFPKRKSNKKNKNDKDLSPSPLKEKQIWEDEHDKSEKKHSKKLKRPKSLDFLADVISPTRKTEKQPRPFSMAGPPIEAEKSPTKKKTLSLFKKKKKPTEPIHIHTDGSVTSEGSVIPSPEHSPDDFRIPDVVDGKVPPENGHPVLTTKISLQSGHSDHSTGLTVQVDNQEE